jgi:hypothetical protein
MAEETYEETARMLAELEERERLEARAAELGVKFRANTGDETLRERISEAESEPKAESEPESEPKPVTGELTLGSVITNPGKYVRRVGNMVFAPGGRQVLAGRNLADERTVLKLLHMIKLGVLHRADD